MNDNISPLVLLYFCLQTCPGGPDKRSLDEKRNGSPEQRSHDGNMAEDDHFVFHTQVSVGLSVVEDGILEKLHSGGGRYGGIFLPRDS